MTEATDIAQLQHISPLETYESPIYIVGVSWKDLRMGATLDSYMNGYEDPRLASYFNTTTDGIYRGIRAGMANTVSKDAYAPEAEGSASTSTASTSAKLGSHTTGVADSGRWSTRRIAMYALFVALAMVTSFIEFPITPVTWLKYDPSGIVCLIAGFAYGPAAAAIVSVLGFVPHMFANPWGSLMAVLVALFLSVPAAFIYRKIRTRKGAAIGILVGAVLAIVVALVSNLIVTPIYAHMTYQAVAAMILPILLPFNVAKMAIHAVITFLIYKPISNLLSKQQ